MSSIYNVLIEDIEESAEITIYELSNNEEHEEISCLFLYLKKFLCTLESKVASDLKRRINLYHTVIHGSEFLKADIFVDKIAVINIRLAVPDGNINDKFLISALSSSTRLPGILVIFDPKESSFSITEFSPNFFIL